MRLQLHLGHVDILQMIFTMLFFYVMKLKEPIYLAIFGDGTVYSLNILMFLYNTRDTQIHFKLGRIIVRF